MLSEQNIENIYHFQMLKKKNSFRNTCILKHINKHILKKLDSERVYLEEWGKKVKGGQGREQLQ